MTALITGATAAALLAGLGWAVNIVIVRWALDRSETTALGGAFVGVGVAAVLVAGVALAVDGLPRAAGFGWSAAWPFALIGAIAPGSSQGLFVASIGSIGPARSSVLVSVNPIFSVLLGMAVLGEGWRVSVMVGTLLVVAGGVLISWEPGLGFRHLGVLLALATALTFGVRDAVARSVTSSTDDSIWWASTTVLAAAAAVTAVIGVTSRRSVRRFAVDSVGAIPYFLGSGASIAVALTSLFVALDRARVGLVAPLSNAMQSIAVVILGGLVFGARERTPRILVALVLVVAGGAIILA